MEFSLFSHFAELEPKEWLMFGALAVAFVALVFVALRAFKKNEPVQKGFDTRALVYGAMCISLSFVLSYIRLLHMPQGGSITPGSMLPIMVYGYWYGPRKGIIAGLAYAVLQMIQDAWFVHPAQILLDYIIAFGVLGCTGFFRKNLYVGVVVSGMLRFLSHFLSGAIFFGEYAPEGMSPWLYSLGYQASCILPDLIICVVIAVLLHKTIERLRPKTAVAA